MEIIALRGNGKAGKVPTCVFTADFSPTVAQLEPDLKQSGCACRAEELTQSSARRTLDP